MNLQYFCQDQSCERNAIESELAAHELQVARWNAAGELGITRLLPFIAEALGHDPASVDAEGNLTFMRSAYGSKRRVMLDVDGNRTLQKEQCMISLYFDGYGRFTTVHVMDDQVYSSHECGKFIVPGRWLELVLALEPLANTENVAKAVSSKASKLRNALKKI